MTEKMMLTLQSNILLLSPNILPIDTQKKKKKKKISIFISSLSSIRCDCFIMFYHTLFLKIRTKQSLLLRNNLEYSVEVLNMLFPVWPRNTRWHCAALRQTQE